MQIVLSGNLDEEQIAILLAQDTPVDAFGVGTRLDVSADSPSMDMAYKLDEYASQARRKRSPGKATWPGVKQVFRTLAASGEISGDCIGLADERLPGQPLQVEVMRDGKCTSELPALTATRAYCRERLAELPPALRTLDESSSGYEVRISPRVEDLARNLDLQDA